MSILIAWIIIGTVFWLGILLEHTFLDEKDMFSAAPVWALVVLFWPAGLAWFERNWRLRTPAERLRFQLRDY